MSEKERAIQLLDRVPEYKMGYVLAYIQGITADEDADDRFCEKMIQDYNSSPDEDKEDIGGVSLINSLKTRKCA